jgi:hypothetical protein
MKRPSFPEQLPDLRAYLAEKWVSPAWLRASVVSHSTEYLVYNAPAYVDELSHERKAMMACISEVRLLQDSSLWWIGPEMCDLLFDSLNGVPADTRIENLDLPSEHGLVMLAKPWESALDANDPHKTITVDAFCWGRTSLEAVPDIPALAVPGTKCLSLSAYRYVDFDAGMVGTELGLAAAYGALDEGTMKKRTLRVEGGNTTFFLEGGDWVPLGRSDWPSSLPLSEPLPTNPRHRWSVSGEEKTAFENSSLQDRRILAALFALIKAPGISHLEDVKPSRQVRRQCERKGKPVPSDVKVVYLRRPARKGEAQGHEGDENHYNHRFIVRAHPRLQAYGPGRKLRKLIMVGPFIKGPDGTPLVTKETVHAWIR